MSNSEVTYRNHMGTDLDVVNAARVSFNKVSTELNDADKGLIKFLAREQHYLPFAHCFLSFHIKAPIFVARQMIKHRVGLSWWDDEDEVSLNWNEVSRRYVYSQPEFFEPDYFRARAENVKQGSSDQPADREATTVYSGITASANKAYGDILFLDVCPEQARMVLPLSTMTEWIWSGSLLAFARVCKLRLDSHAQVEAQEIANRLAVETKERFPFSFAALMGD